ncbi:hypothetical protein BGX29_004185 [Mortierella sp. GBA35]|nr:hypothetical protein BGX29_004185 [Mortierella sp. GBA35]
MENEESYEHGRPIDIYAFGAMVHCMLFGDTPDHKELSYLQLKGSVDPLAEVLWGTLQPEPNAADEDESAKRTKEASTSKFSATQPTSRSTPTNGFGAFTRPTQDLVLRAQVASVVHCVCFTIVVHRAQNDLAPSAGTRITSTRIRAALFIVPCTHVAIFVPFDCIRVVGKPTLLKVQLPSLPRSQQPLADSTEDDDDDTSIAGGLERYANTNPTALPRKTKSPLSQAQGATNEPAWLEIREQGSGEILGDLPLPFEDSQ